MAATVTWRPEQEPLQQLVQYLNDSLTGCNENIRKKAEIIKSQN